MKNELFSDDKHKLYFITYDKNNLQHNLFLKDIANDEEINTYISSLPAEIINEGDKNNSYTGFLVKDKVIHDFVGVVSFSCPLVGLDATPIHYAVHKKYRGSNQKYGSRILIEMTNLLLAMSNVPRVLLEVKRKNISCQRAAENAGFTVDDELNEKFLEEGYEYIPYSIYNKQYKNEAFVSGSKSK
jgi:RimJ/RimL family protein N-acetyltransferase